MNSILKRPSAWLPIAMSFAALGTVFVFFAMFGVVHETDEGAAAHIFQLLMAGQVPIVVFFAITWLPQRPRQALWVLMFQIAAALIAFAPVFFLKL